MHLEAIQVKQELIQDLWISPDQEFSDVSQHLLTLEPPGLENEDHDPKDWISEPLNKTQ